MERLILLRHGKAEPDSESGDDFDRRVVECGAEHIAADTAEAVNAYFNCHFLA